MPEAALCDTGAAGAAPTASHEMTLALSEEACEKPALRGISSASLAPTERADCSVAEQALNANTPTSVAVAFAFTPTSVHTSPERKEMATIDAQLAADTESIPATLLADDELLRPVSKMMSSEAVEPAAFEECPIATQAGNNQIAFAAEALTTTAKAAALNSASLTQADAQVWSPAPISVSREPTCTLAPFLGHQQRMVAGEAATLAW